MDVSIIITELEVNCIPWLCDKVVSRLILRGLESVLGR